MTTWERTRAQRAAREFDELVAMTAAEDGSLVGSLPPGWGIGEGINGGALMAFAATAMQRTLAGDPGAGRLDPLTVSAHYFSAASAGPVTARTELIRVGRTMASGQVSLVQEVDGAPVERMRALATYGDLTRQASPVLRSRPAPVMPPPEGCVSADVAPPEFVAALPILARMDLRLDPDTVGWALGRPSRQGRLRGWIRFADGRPIDPMSLLFFLDAMPPVAFDLGIMGWAPTVELTSHVRAVPVDGWLHMELSTETVTGSLLEEDAVIWDESGRMVAQSRQLAAIRLPASPEDGEVQ
ncbi:MAG: thioesterase family protein [Nostocoides sp.]